MRSNPVNHPGMRFTRDWPSPSAKASVALVHGLAEHSARYEHVAARLNEGGYAVFSADLRGHGRSDGFPGQVAGLADWSQDVESILARAREAIPGRPSFLLGHSMGALISAAYVSKAEDPPDGLVLSAYAGLAGTALITAMSDPDSPGIPPEIISRDPAIVKAYADDPLVFNDRVPVECNAAALEAAITANQGAAMITVPTLMLHGSADEIADIEGAREFHLALGSVGKDFLVYDSLFHEVMNEPEKQQVLDDIVRWLDRHTGS